MLAQKIALDIVAESDKFLRMQNDYADLAQKAVKAAMALDWALARDLNLEILKQDDSNFDAKNRLGKAYLELRDFTKAKKLFREVLAVDPINPIAKRNLELAKEEKHSVAPNGKQACIIQEPATFIQSPAEIVAKGFTASKLPMGAELEVRVFSQFAKLFYPYKDQKIELAIVTEPTVVKKLKAGKDLGASLCATYVKGVDKEITVLINSTLPVFEGERQELKPYTKRDFTDSDNEPEPVLEEN